MRDFMRELASEAAAGAAATVAMTGVMAGVQRATDRGHLAPSRIVRVGMSRAGVHLNRHEHRALTAIAHLAFGTALGPVLGALHRRTSRLPAPLLGTLFGVGVWAVSYGGWLPALALMPRPHRDRPGRQAATFLAHLAYGGVLGALLRRTRRG